MLEHMKHPFYIDVIYCPGTHQLETFKNLDGDTEPGGQACNGCQELIELNQLQEQSS